MNKGGINIDERTCAEIVCYVIVFLIGICLGCIAQDKIDSMKNTTPWIAHINGHCFVQFYTENGVISSRACINGEGP